MPDEDPVVPAGGTPPAAAPPAAAPPPAPAPRVVGHGGGEIPPERVSEIRAAERRKFNKENYGTEDEDEVARIKASNAAKLKKAEELEAEQEKKRLESLSEKDRLAEELRVERAQRAEEKSKLERERDVARQSLEVERQDVLITSLASKYVKPSLLKAAKVEFGEYIDTLTQTQMKALKQPDIDKWFAKFVKDNPDYKPAAPAVTKTAEELAAEKAERDKNRAPVVPPKRPVGAPARPGTRPAPAPAAKTGKGFFNGKAVKDLNKTELAAYRKSLGMKPNPY